MANLANLQDFAIKKALMDAIKNGWIAAHPGAVNGKTGHCLTFNGEIELVTEIERLLETCVFSQFQINLTVPYPDFLGAVCVRMVEKFGHPVVALLNVKYFNRDNPESVRKAVLEGMDDK